MKLLIIMLFFSINSHSQAMKNYTMDKKYFSCKIPAKWSLERQKDSDIESNIYKIVVKEPKKNTSITIKYYALKSNKDIKTYIETQSKNSQGKLETPTEKYEAIKEIEFKSKKATEINRKLKEFQSIENDSNSYWLKERILVIPAKKGFYSVIYSAKEEDFDKSLPIYEKVINSLKTLY